MASELLNWRRQNQMIFYISLPEKKIKKPCTGGKYHVELSQVFHVQCLEFRNKISRYANNWDSTQATHIYQFKNIQIQGQKEIKRTKEKLKGNNVHNLHILL